MALPVVCTEEEAEALGLAEYLRTGHLLLRGFLGSLPVTVAVTRYAQQKMERRDIIVEEILELLARPLSSHSPGQRENRFEVTYQIDRRLLHAIYDRKTKDFAVVVTAYQE